MSAVHARALALYAGSPRITPLPLPADTAISGASPGGATLGAISTTAATGLTTAQLAQTTASTASANANTALSQLGSKLSAADSYVLGGNITLSSVGGGVYTSGFPGGTGWSGTDNGFVFRQGGVTKLSLTNYGEATFGGALSAATGTFAGSLTAASGTFTGTLDCQGGAIVRAPSLAGVGQTVDLIKLQLPSTDQFGSLIQGPIGSASNVVAGWQFNFQASGGNAGAALSAINTANGQAGRLLVASDGSILRGLSTDSGESFSWAPVPVANGVTQTNLNAHLLQGHDASAFAVVGHNHQIEALSSSTSGGTGRSAQIWVSSGFTFDAWNSCWIFLN